jgi:hypothetical protein
VPVSHYPVSRHERDRITEPRSPAPRGDPPGGVLCVGAQKGLVVKVAAALGLPLPTLSPVAVAALAGPLDLGRRPREGGPGLVGSISVAERQLRLSSPHDGPIVRGRDRLG